jgi:hypothetical protein
MPVIGIGIRSLEKPSYQRRLSCLTLAATMEGRRVAGVLARRLMQGLFGD